MGYGTTKSVGIMLGIKPANFGRYGLFEDVSIEQGNFHSFPYPPVSSLTWLAGKSPDQLVAYLMAAGGCCDNI